MSLTTRVRLEDVTDITPITETTGPYPDAAYERLRDRWGPVAPVELEPGLPAWLTLGYQEFCEVVRDDSLFSRRGTNWRYVQEGLVPPTSGLIPWISPRENAFSHDGDRRRTLREPIDAGIAGVDGFRLSSQVRTTCADLVERFRERGTADLMTEYAVAVPLLAIAGMFGMSEEAGQELLLSTWKLFDGGAEAPVGLAEIDRLLLAHINARRTDPADDLTTAYLEHPGFTSNVEVLEALSLTMVAGYELTVGLIVQTLLLMLTDPRFARQVRGGQLDVDQAIDVVLWRDPPSYNIPPRFALRDTSLGTQLIRRGDAVVPSVYAANTDPTMAGDEDPWQEVGNRAHLAWSAGLHVCPGRRPGLMIVRAAVEAALTGLPEIQLAVPEDNIPRLSGSPWSRYPVSLPVTFAPMRARSRV